MTRVFKPVYLDEELGELGRLPDNSIVNIGGTSSPTFTVGGRALLFDDGSSTGSGSGTGFTLQVAYGNSAVPAQINTTTGKNIVFNAVNGNQFVFNADTGNITIGGSLNLSGLLNGVPISSLIDHLNSSLTPKHSAAQISFDDSGLANISGADVQAAIESIDSQLNSISVGDVQGFEFIQSTPVVAWYIQHNGNSDKIQCTVWATTTADYGSGPVTVQEAILPDAVSIVDANTVYVVFASPQSGRAILMLF